MSTRIFNDRAYGGTRTNQLEANASRTIVVLAGEFDRSVTLACPVLVLGNAPTTLLEIATTTIIASISCTTSTTTFLVSKGKREGELYTYTMRARGKERKKGEKCVCVCV